MTLREELEDRADKLDAELLALSGRMKEIERQSADVHTCLNALDLAEMEAEDIAVAANFAAEQETAPAPEEAERIIETALKRQFNIDAPAPVEIEIPEDGLGSSLIAMGYGDDDTPAEHISDLTGDPAIEPEAGLHEESPALNADMQDEREQPVTDVAALIASGEHSYDEVAAIAYPEPEGYAPVTNPAADEAAKAYDWYDPKAVADRNKFNPWAGVSNLFGKPKVDA